MSKYITFTPITCLGCKQKIQVRAYENRSPAILICPYCNKLHLWESNRKNLYCIECGKCFDKVTTRQEGDITCGKCSAIYGFGVHDNHFITSRIINKLKRELFLDDPVFRCPKCGGRMDKKTATKGHFKGKDFWACRDPDCNSIEPIRSTTKCDSCAANLRLVTPANFKDQLRWKCTNQKCRRQYLIIEKCELNFFHLQKARQKSKFVQAFPISPNYKYYPWLKFGGSPAPWNKYYATREWRIDVRKKIVVPNKFCVICKKIVGDSYFLFQMHHVIPITRGGSNKSNNLAVVCSLCHALIHNKVEIFIQSLFESFWNYYNLNEFLQFEPSKAKESILSSFTMAAHYLHASEKFKQAIARWNSKIELGDILKYYTYKMTYDLVYLNDIQFYNDLVLLVKNFEKILDQDHSLAINNLVFRHGYFSIDISLSAILYYSIFKSIKPLRECSSAKQMVEKAVGIIAEYTFEKGIAGMLTFFSMNKDGPFVHETFLDLYSKFEIDNLCISAPFWRTLYAILVSVFENSGADISHSQTKHTYFNTSVGNHWQSIKKNLNDLLQPNDLNYEEIVNMSEIEKRSISQKILENETSVLDMGIDFDDWEPVDDLPF